MATDMQLISDVTFEAAADLSTKQFHFVKLSAANTVDVCTATTDNPIGILQNKPSAAGRPAVVRLFGMSKVVASGIISAGALIATEADAEAGIPATNDPVVGKALEAATAQGDLIKVLINCVNPYISA
jgi:hypothetical protein